VVYAPFGVWERCSNTDAQQPALILYIIYLFKVFIYMPQFLSTHTDRVALRWEDE